MLIYVWMAIANNQQFWTWHLKCTYSYSLFSQRICSCTGCTATRMYACVCVRVHCATHSAHSIRPPPPLLCDVWCQSTFGKFKQTYRVHRDSPAPGECICTWPLHWRLAITDQSVAAHNVWSRTNAIARTHRHTSHHRRIVIVHTYTRNESDYNVNLACSSLDRARLSYNIHRDLRSVYLSFLQPASLTNDGKYENAMHPPVIKMKYIRIVQLDLCYWHFFLLGLLIYLFINVYCDTHKKLYNI